MAAPCNCSRCRSTRATSPLIMPSPAPSTMPRSHFNAYAEYFILTPCSSGSVIPLQQHQSQGGYTCRGGAITIPSDGYYMLLWELGIEHAKPTVYLQLGINNSGSLLASELSPGHDSGQQTTWLNRGDMLSLQVLGDEHGELHGSNAQLTIIRLG